MQRIVVSADNAALTILDYRPAQAADAAVSLVIAAALLPIASLGLAAGYAASRPALGPLVASIDQAVAIAFCIPSAFFAGLFLMALLRCVAPRRVVVARASRTLVVGGRAPAPLDKAERLRIAFTGYSSPSRFALVADIAGRSRPLRLATTGYFGDRRELEQLSQMIADYTGRFDFYAR